MSLYEEISMEEMALDGRHFHDYTKFTTEQAEDGMVTETRMCKYPSCDSNYTVFYWEPIDTDDSGNKVLVNKEDELVPYHSENEEYRNDIIYIAPKEEVKKEKPKEIDNKLYGVSVHDR